MFQLTWYPGSQSTSPHRAYREIRAGESLTVGREDGADIVLKDKAVSRLHAEIYADSSGVHIRDAGSANGVLLDGKRVRNSVWQPGQSVTLGTFVFDLSPLSTASGFEVVEPNRRLTRSEPPRLARVEPPQQTGFDSRLGESAPRGRIELGEVFQQARSNNKQAVKELFSGFMGKSEQIVDCGYLGALGFVFPEYSFWCVTNSRICGLLVNHAGWMQFNFGFLRSLNRGVFVQPSLVLLWIWLIAWGILVFLLSLFLAKVAVSAGSGSFIGDSVAFMAAIVVFVLLIAIGITLVPLVVRAFYRFVKAGCIFWTRELVPIVIPSDRYSLRDAQRFISVYTDQRRMLGD